jgi:phosphoglycerate dehydrogenase-like enzyme
MYVLLLMKAWFPFASTLRASQTNTATRASIKRYMAASSSKDPLFWNRVTSTERDFDQNAPIVKEAKIISLTDVKDKANGALNDAGDCLPEGSQLLAVGGSMQDFDVERLRESGANVVFVSHPNSREPLAQLLEQIPTIEWVHSRAAGIDFVASPALTSWKGGIVTNAKGSFSSTLAEYTLMACSYFAKDLPRLLRNKKAKNWDKYPVLELRGATLGIVGYGDIGRACARLAAVYGMKVIALRRRPLPDPFCTEVYGNDKDSLNRLFQKSDYILCSAPLTSETKGMIGKAQFDNAKEGAVFINVGRGPIVDEEALIEALRGRLKGAGLDVFAIEPLPTDSPLWDMENVLLSPHNMDKTDTFMHEATEFFVEENLPRFLRGLPLLNQVNPADGY